MAVTIGKAIKMIREAKGKSLGVVANESGLSVPYLSLVESDKRTPSLEAIGRIAQCLDVPTDVFLLIGSGENSSLSSSDDLTERLLGVVRRMETLRQKLKDTLGEQGCEATS
jgi:transcriptional regulator with XRE-family HTH domain